MAYIPRSSPRFDNNFKRLTKKNRDLKDRVQKKIREILENPEIGETLSQSLADYPSKVDVFCRLLGNMNDERSIRSSRCLNAGIPARKQPSGKREFNESNLQTA